MQCFVARGWRLFGIVLVCCGLAACGGNVGSAERGADSRATASPPIAQLPVQRYTVVGLQQPGEILVDTWGVPHLYAGETYDAFFLQGFNAARDRLWQIDLWRRRGLGQLSAVFGEQFVAQDRAARLFLYRGSMYREWLAYGSDAKRITESFVAGINAFVALTAAQPELLPPEFGMLGYAPATWSAEDVVRIRSHGLWRNVVSEVRRARSLCALGPDGDRIRAPLEPQWQFSVPDGLDPCALPDDLLDDYALATAPVRFAADGRPQAARVDDLPDRDTLAALVGSNNWAVSPTRTSTGRPILADDPHRGHAVPSLRYVTHLVAPGLDVIGAGEPALPGISIGHNERIAFGLTIFPMDQEDLYFYAADPERADRYLRAGRSDPLRMVRETIAVRGAADVEVELPFTAHGPVIHQGERIWAVRAAWLEPGMAPYFGSIEYMRARNWDEFVAALNRWGAPSENQVYADVDGNIGYMPAGLLPRRRDHDGLLPVPGDGRYEWDDFHDMDTMPHEFNPAQGYVATANALTLPEDYPIDAVRVGFEWTAPWRQNRIREVLAATPDHTLADSLALQRDYTSLPARHIVAALAGLPEFANDATEARAARRMLEDFDAVMLPDSAAAALFQVWFSRHLRPGVSEALYGAVGVDVLGAADTRAAVTAVEGSLAGLSEAARQQLVVSTLAAAWSDISALLGDDPAAWRWGDLHRIAFEHPLLAQAPTELAQRMELPNLPMGGSGYTPNNTSFLPADFLVRGGASWRMVLDVGRWDDSRMTNSPGQSGVPGSAHYGDLLEGWAQLQSWPLLYSRSAVEAAAQQRILLEPAP